LKSSAPRDVITIDLSVGGHGDNWMRLVGFYVAAGIKPGIEIRLVLPPLFRQLAPQVFGDRLKFVELYDRSTLHYTGLGLRDLLPKAIRGKRYLVPYHRPVIHDWNRWTVKDRVNALLHTSADSLKLLQLPPWEAIGEYQALLEVQCVAKLRDISPAAFYARLFVDYDSLMERMSGPVPKSATFVQPDELAQSVVVFPSGTSRQFIPLWWAKQHLPDALYAFFFKDPDEATFKAAGLRTVSFASEPGDIVALARGARWTISTDSFPSHLIQYSTRRATILMTELVPKRIVTAPFKGAVVAATAPCHPCPHLERKSFPKCKAGHSECVNWQSPVYSAAVLKSIEAPPLIARPCATEDCGSRG
jgi:hypothetical protein